MQGLELDWTGLVWDGDLRFSDGGWTYHGFRGRRWTSVNKEERKAYLKNAYRVLYRSDLKLADAVEELKSRVATQPELKIFVDFIGESTRSLVR